MVPSAASRRIAQLEQELGARLLHRSRRGVSLTPAGAIAVEQATAILSAYDKLYSDLQAFNANIKEDVRIWAASSALRSCLPRAFQAFDRASAQIGVDIEERIDQEVVDAIGQGVIDIGLFSSHLSAPGLETYTLEADDIVLVVPCDHPLAEREAVSFEESLRFDFVGWAAGISLGSAMQAAASASNSPLKIKFRVKSIEALCSLISGGLAIGSAPRPDVIPVAQSYLLKTVTLQDAWARRAILMGYRSFDALGPAARAFAQCLQRTAAVGEPRRT
jgi:DNA-binding transcriptional LysR family regulator